MVSKITCFLILFLCMGSCITIPKIDGELQSQLESLAEAGKEPREIKSPVLAGILNIFPGAGQFYTGDIGDGIITLLFCWTGYHYIIGFFDAVQEARVQNATYTVQFYKKQGFKFSFNLLNGEPLIRESYKPLGLSFVIIE